MQVVRWATFAALALPLAYVNTHTDELGVVVPGLVMSAAIVAWLWWWPAALALGLVLPLSQAAAFVLGMHLPYANDLSGAINATIGGLLFAGLGAAIGSLARLSLRGALERG